MNGQSLDIFKDNLHKLQALFPDIFSEGKIDLEKFKATFTDDINFNNERYVLNWAGKADAFKVLQIPTTASLKPMPEESINFDTTENIFIEGENLEVLKVLQKSYYGKIKVVCIDPPYNTGSDSFIYPDSFKENKADYEKRIGDKDEEGFLMKEGLFRKNSKDSGHYHSNWLSMMYPRLFLAKNLLKDDGVIFVHIDDNEVHNLRLLMNEIFGEENFVAQIIIQVNKGGRDYLPIAVTHEYLMCFQKKDDAEINELPKANLVFPFKDSKGGYETRELRNRNPKFNRANRPNLFYPFYANSDSIDANGYCLVSLEKSKGYSIEIFPLNSEGKESCWRWGKNKVLHNNTLTIDTTQVVAKEKKAGGWNVYEKNRKATSKVKSIWDESEVRTENGTKDFRILFNAAFFDHPKPIATIKKNILLSTTNEEEDIILDFFGGSGTTAQAVLELNKEDGGNRKFILVQLPELSDEESEAFKSGYKTIADISKERIRRVIKKIEKEKAEKPDMFDNGKLDLGFKAFKLSSSNFKIWRGNEITEDNLATQLDVFINPVKEESKADNMLYELMLKAGYLLTDKVDAKQKYYAVKDGELIVALEEISQHIIDTIIASQPQKVITLDNLFAGNDQLKTNTALQMKDAGVEFKTI